MKTWPEAKQSKISSHTLTKIFNKAEIDPKSQCPIVDKMLLKDQLGTFVEAIP